METTLSVMLLNRSCFAVGAPLLYRAVCITAPSQLTRFVSALAQRPALGRMVEHLYIGAGLRQNRLFVSLLLAGIDSYEQAYALSPRTMRESRISSHPCNAHGSLLPHAFELAVAEECALFAGTHVQAHGIDLFRPGFDRAGTRIGLDEWVLRLFDGRDLVRWMRALAFQTRHEAAQMLRTEPNPAAASNALKSRASDAAAKLEAYARDNANAVPGAAPTAEADPSSGDAPAAGLSDAAFAPRSLASRRAGTRHDPLDWGDASMPVDPIPETPESVYPELAALQLDMLRDWDAALDADLPTGTRLPTWLRLLVAKAAALGQVQALYAAVAGELDTVLYDVRAVRHPELLRARTEAAAYFRAHDRFDDPCLFARSGAIPFLLGDEHTLGAHGGAGGAPRLWEQVAMHDADAWTPAQPNQATTPTRETLLSSFERRPFGVPRDAFGLPLPADAVQLASAALDEGTPLLPEPTLGSILACVQSVLGMVPNVRSLCLSGVLERAMAGYRTSVQLPHLAALLLGPPPPYWASPLNFGSASHPTFRTLTHLGISGCMLLPAEAAALAGANGALPRLQSLNWTMWQCTQEQDASALINAVCTLLQVQREQPPADAGGSAPAAHSSAAVEGQQAGPPAGGAAAGPGPHSVSDTPPRRGVPKVHIKLHPTDYQQFCTNAPEHVLHDPRLSLSPVCEADLRHQARSFEDWARYVRGDAQSERSEVQAGPVGAVPNVREERADQSMDEGTPI